MSRDVILHVDDDANDVLLFQHAYRKANLPLRVITVSDGDEALAYLAGRGRYSRRDEHPIPNLMLLDLKMPRVSGFDVLLWLRKQESFRHLPVVVLSSSNHQSDIARAYDLGANSYVVKPVGFDELVAFAKILHQYWLILNEPAPDQSTH